MAKTKKLPIKAFNFPTGRTLAKKYEVVSKLGGGYEGEVYLLREHSTGIERAAKFFFPQRNKRNKSLNFYAKKLHKLRACPALIQYHTQETIHYGGEDISFLISDYVEGEILQDFLLEQPGGRLDVFQGLHFLYALTLAIEGVHQLNDYHGDLHPGNIIVRRRGIGFEIKLLDFFHWGKPSAFNLKDDVLDVIEIFYNAIGGRARYAKQPPEVKQIVLGLKSSLILKKFRTITHLRAHLENMAWSEVTS